MGRAAVLWITKVGSARWRPLRHSAALPRVATANERLTVNSQDKTLFASPCLAFSVTSSWNKPPTTRAALLVCVFGCLDSRSVEVGILDIGIVGKQDFGQLWRYLAVLG